MGNQEESVPGLIQHHTIRQNHDVVAPLKFTPFGSNYKRPNMKDKVEVALLSYYGDDNRWWV